MAPQRASRRGLMRAAAAVAVVAVGGGMLTSRAYAWSRAETGIGEAKTLALPDGSRMVLNTDSAVAWRFDGARRRMRLERGEVALDVAPRDVPLAIEGGGLHAQLSGGRFNVRLRAGALDVMVLRGAAEVPAANGSHAVAHPFHSLLATGEAANVRAASRDEVAATLAWQNGEILFQDEPLAAAVEEYNRYLTGKIVLIDSGLGAVRVGGRFTTSDPSAFLESLQASLDIEVQTTNGTYLLLRKK